MKNKSVLNFNIFYNAGAFLSILICLSLISVISGGCGYGFLKPASRADKVKSSPAINIGAVWPHDADFKSFANGVTMASDEINRAGGVIGKKINIVFKNDNSDVTRGMVIADEFANEADICAVVGFYDSHVTLPASNIYNSAGILMITISVTDPAYNSFKSPILFRTIPDADDIAARLAAVLKKSGYKKVMICYVNDKYGLSSANATEDELKKQSISVVDRRSFISGSENEFSQIIECWKLLKFDCVIIYGEAVNSVDFIKMLRSSNITVPVFCGDGADSPQVINAAREYTDGVVFVSFFNPGDRSAKLAAFEAEYIKKFAVPPGTYAPAAYDAVMLAAEGIKFAKSAAPPDIARALRALDNYEGVANKYSFDEGGEVKNKKVVLKMFNGDKFIYLDTTNEADLIKKAALKNEKWK